MYVRIPVLAYWRTGAERAADIEIGVWAQNEPI